VVFKDFGGTAPYLAKAPKSINYLIDQISVNLVENFLIGSKEI